MEQAQSQTGAIPLTDAARETLADQIGNAAAVEIERRLGNALSSDVRRAWRNDFAQLVQTSDRNTFTAQDGKKLLAAFRAHVADHCKHAARERNHIDAADHLKTLRWKLASAVTRMPLDGDSEKVRESQRAWIRDYVSQLPEVRSSQGLLLVGRKSTLEELEAMFDDPLQTVFCQPFSNEQFEKLRTELSGYDKTRELVHVLPHLVRHATYIRVLPIHRDWEMWSDKLVSAGHSGTLIRLGFGSSADNDYAPIALHDNSSAAK